MIIGPLTIQWTKTVQREEQERVKNKEISTKVVESLLHELRQDKAALRRWGLSEGIIEGGGGQEPKPPKGAAAAV